MATALAQYAVGRDNNFNLIRFVAATLVLWSHSFPLSGRGDDEPLLHAVGMSWGTAAVDVFFVTSGFLIARSFFERRSLIGFFWARILRIYPGLVVAVLFSALVVGAIFTTHGLAAYLTAPETRAYILANSYLLSGIHYALPGVFTDNPYPDAVNGSLWTLPYEVKLYIRLALAGLILAALQRYLGRSLLGPIFLLGALVAMALNLGYQLQGETSEHLVRFSAFFFAGTAFYLYRDRVVLSSPLFVALAAALILSALERDLFVIVYSLSLPYLILYLAYVPSGLVRDFNRLGDYSYGIYIYAFPVQQSVASMAPQMPVYALSGIAFAITLVLASLSWHIVEKRCLGMKDRYLVVERAIGKVSSKIAEGLTRA